MPPSNTKDLYLNITGGTDGLTRAAKAARLTMADVGSASGDLQQIMADNFQKLGGSEMQASARSLETAFKRTLSNIRAAAEQEAGKPLTAATIVTTNVRGAQQALETSEAQVAVYRQMADAAAVASRAGGDLAERQRTLAITLEAEVLAAQEDVAVKRQQLLVLQQLRTQLGITTDAQDEQVASHNRMGSSGMIAEHVVRSLSDSIAAGQSPVRALTMEMGRITEAMTLYAAQTNATEGAMGKFAAFMGGPWGIAVSIGVAVLTPLVAELFEGGNASDKMKEKTLGLVDALSAEKFGTEAATKALQDYNAEKDRARQSDAVGQQQAMEEAQKRIGEASQRRDQYRSQAAKLLSEPLPLDPAGQQARVGTIQRLNSQANAETGNINNARAIIRNIEIQQAGEAAKAAADPIEAIRKKYEMLGEQADHAAASNDKLAASLKQTRINLAQQEAAEIKAEQARQRDDKPVNQIGRTISLDQAEQIVRGFGGRITSGYRSTAEQQTLYNRYLAGTGSLAAKPGTSEHESGQALDIAKAAGITLKTIRDAFMAQGVRPTELLDEGNHYHVAWGPKGPSQATLDKRAQAQVTSAANDDRAFQGQLASAQSGYANAQIALTGNPDLAGRVERSSLYDGLTQKRAELADQVTAKKLTQAQADQLNELYSGTEELAEIGSLQKQRLAAIDQQLATEQQQAASAIGVLNLQESLATTAKARRDLALKALAAEEARARAPLQAIVDHQDLHTPEQVTAAKAGLAQIDAEHPYRVQQIDQRNASPLADAGKRLQDNVGDIRTDLQNIEVNWIDSLTSALGSAAEKALHLHGVLGDIASDVLKVFIQRQIELPLINELSPVKGGGGGSGGGIGSLLKRAAGLLGLGGNSAFKSPSTFFDTGFDSALGSDIDGFRAGGGSVGPNQTFEVGEHGPELLRMGNDPGMIIPHAVNDVSAADMRAMSAAPSVQVGVQVQEGALFRPVVSAIAAQHAAVAQQNATNDGAALAEQNRMWAQGRQLGSG